MSFFDKVLGRGKEVPRLSMGTVGLISTLYPAIYIIPFYVHPAARPSPTLSRDSPSCIRPRCRLALLSTATCLALTFTILTQPLPFLLPEGQTVSPSEALRRMGLWPVSLKQVVYPLLNSMILFSGPIFERLIAHGGWHHPLEWLKDITTTFYSLPPAADDDDDDNFDRTFAYQRSWVRWRNYVVGPLTEELLFRAALLPLSLSIPSSAATAAFPSSTSSPPTSGGATATAFPGDAWRTLLLAPLPFALAHAHHFYEFRITHPGWPWLNALLAMLFQLVYTALFGWWAAWVWLRTGSAWGCLVGHSFANTMGFPKLWGRLDSGREEGWERVEVEAEDEEEEEEDEGEGKATGRDGAVEGKTRRRGGTGEGSEKTKKMSYRRIDNSIHIGYTVVYYALIFGGAFGFWKTLHLLTDTGEGFTVL